MDANAFIGNLFHCEIVHAAIEHIPTGDLFDLRAEMREAAEWMSNRLLDIEIELGNRHSQDEGSD